MTLRHKIVQAAALAVFAACSAVPAAATGESLRPMQIDDMFELEAIGRYYGGPYAFSPDGRAVAFTRVRPKKSLTNHLLPFLWGNAGGDVWLQSAPGQVSVNLTQGIEDGTGWWAPQWSPDGERLAMLSTRGGNVTLWVWEKSSGQLRQLTTRGVDLVEVRKRPFVWVDKRHLLCPVLPEGEKPLGMRILLDTPNIASIAWSKVAKGQEVTASVLESGVPVDLSERPQGQLLLIDAVNGTRQTIVSASTSHWQVSPNHQAVAFVRQVGVYLPKDSEPLPFGISGTYTVELRTLDGRRVTTDKPLPTNVLPDSLRWSPDGGKLAFLSWAGSRQEAPLLYTVEAGTERVRQFDLGRLDAAPIIRLLPQLAWTAAGDILLLAAERTDDRKPAVTARRDWWLIARDGSRRILTKEMKTPPAELWPQEGRTAFVGLADGEIWRVRAGGQAVENLTARFEPQITRIAWPILTNSGAEEYPHAGRSYSQIVLASRRERSEEFFRLDLVDSTLSALAKPAAQAGLVAFAPASDSAIYSASDRQGTFIWRSAVDGDRTDELMAANHFLQDIDEGEFKAIDYTSLDGEALKAWVILPVGYKSGKTYPTITWVYAGSVAGAVPSPYDSISRASALNKQIPPANGYAVLIPSMPLVPGGEVGDPMLQLLNGVMPAVDKAIEMGIADPTRLFLMGQSFGGYSTYGLVTQTKRFDAAVSLAGLSNLISLYGQFDARRRYTDHPQENLFQAALMESAQVRMGSPPWKDLGRYIRNSPIFLVDRVETPLMIIQGDMDYVAIQQGEEFFMSLYRQGKRAKFVRYWGEGHVLGSPANIRDMWQRIFAWFDEFSPETSSSTQTNE